MPGLRMLLEPVELVQVVHRYQPGHHEIPHLAHEISCGTPGFGAGDITACDRQKVFGFDTGHITDMRGRAAHRKGSQGVLGQVVAQAGLEEQVCAESLGVDAHGAHEHPGGNINVAHTPAQRIADRIGDVGS